MIQNASVRLVIILVVIAVALSAVAPPFVAATATTDGEHSPALVVSLHEDGSATVSITQTFDLETSEDRAAFQSLSEDSTVRQNANERFVQRMADVAADASLVTGREMTVSNPTMDLWMVQDGAIGIVQLSVHWSNLAVEHDGTLVVTEPFASGFEPDRQFSVVGPDGYELDDAAPDPTGADGNSATWDAGADLHDFEVTFVPDGEASRDGGLGDVAENAPGFGALATVGAIVAALLLGTRLRSSH